MVKLEETLKVFIKDLEEERFYDAHEDMEAYWHTIRKTEHPLRNLCKGFINGATAFELLRIGREDAANRVWKTYKKYLPLLKEGIEAYPLFCQANKILLDLEEKHKTIFYKRNL